MENVPNKIYLNLGCIDKNELKSIDFNELSEITWNNERINDTDIEYLNGETAFPVFDLLQEHLQNGAEILFQDEEWGLFDKDGEFITGGENLRELCINLIFTEC